MAKKQVKKFIVESNKLLFEKAPSEEELKRLYSEFLDTLTGHDEAPSFEDFKEYYLFEPTQGEKNA